MPLDFSTPGSLIGSIYRSGRDLLREGGDLLVDNIITRRILDSTGLVATLNDEVTVEVTGQPGVTKQQLYFCALATANGIVRRFGDILAATPTYGTLMIEYDASANWVRCTIAYRWSMLANNAFGAVGADGKPLAIGSLFSRMAVYRGPACAVVGAPFDFTGGIIGMPNSSESPGAPNLPLRGDTILSSCPRVIQPTPSPITQNPVPTAPLIIAGPEIAATNPKPPGDNRSRGSVMVPEAGPGSVTGGVPVPGPPPTSSEGHCCVSLRALVPLIYASLTSPASNAKTTYPLPTPGPTGG